MILQKRKIRWSVSQLVLPTLMLFLVGLLTIIHYAQAASYQKAVTAFGLFQEARKDLGEGLLAAVLGERPGSAFGREAGLALLDQTANSLARFQEAWASEMGDGPRISSLMADFRLELSELRDLVSGRGPVDETVSLRLASYDLDRVIVQIDQMAQGDMEALHVRLGQEFAALMAAAVMVIFGVAFLLAKTNTEKQTAQDRLDLMARSTKIGFWYRDLGKGKFEATERCKILMGLDPGAVISDLKDWEDLFHPDDRARRDQDIKRWLASDENDTEQEYRVVHPDGSVHWVLFLASLERDDAGRPTGISGSLLDITERKRLEAERESLTAQVIQSQKTEALGRLAGGIAHDINNLLVPVLTYSDLGRSPKSTHPTDYYFERIKAVAERAATLTRRILAFSRQQVLERKVLDLNALVSDFEAIVRRMLPETIRFQVSLAPDLPAILADSGQVEQVILNLVLNARDAMPGGGTLGLTTAFQVLDDGFVGTHYGTVPGPQVVLTVTDTGTGMDPDVLGQIFDPFFTTKPRGQGTGLGLSTVQGIVRQHGGQVSVYSEPGSGAVFKVYWPALDAPPSLAEPVPPRANGGTETILVVEDDEAVRDVVKETLESRGYRLIAVAGGKEALEVTQPFDLLVTDVVMPDMDGGTLHRHLETKHPGLRVLFMSGYTDKLISTDEAPGRGFLQKPFSGEALDRKIRDLLEQTLSR